MEEEIKKILFEVLPDYEGYNGDDMVRDGLIDSMAILELLSELEEKYDIEFPQEEIVSKNFKNTETIAQMIQRNK